MLGSPSMLPIVENICKKTGDTLEINTYERLSSLHVMKKGLKNYENIEAGDCVVGFSRSKLYDIKYDIERNCQDKRCCVI
jgi:ATP-dependent RNA helicase SUPV3L1/SUV3